MRVNHIFKSATGGAGDFSYRIHLGLIKQSIDSKIYIMNDNHSKRSEKLHFSNSIPSKVIRYFNRIKLNNDISKYDKKRRENKILEKFSDIRNQHKVILNKNIFNCDVLHIHDLAGVIDFKNLIETIPENLPIVWTILDMNPFTGGCHYSHGCNKFELNCGACPILCSEDENDLSKKIWKMKNKILDKLEIKNISLVAISNWSKNEIKKSSLMKNFSTTVIPGSVDTNTFMPKERFSIRESLDIPQESFVILFIAENINAKRKGLDSLKKAISGINNKNLFLLTVGSINRLDELNIPFLNMGYISNDKILSMIYNAADTIVIPSKQEAFGLIGIEAMACGKSVIAFNNSGMSDYVKHAKNGLLVSNGDILSLRDSIEKLSINPEINLQFGIESRNIALKKYSLSGVSTAYIDLYNSLIKT